MQKTTSTIIVALALGLASCSQVENIEPAAEQNIITTDVDIRVNFNPSNHEVVDLDIDSDGNTDFLFFAKSISGPSWGDLAMVGLLAGREGNQVVASSTDQDLLCQMGVPMSPGKTLSASDDISLNSTWAADAMLYGRSKMNDGCEEFKKYIDYGQDRYVGVRFQKNGELHYGYVKLVAVDTVEGEYPASADIWRISQFGYSEEVSPILNLPA